MIFNLLQTLPIATDNPVNVTDSMKVAAQAMAQELVNDPGAFAEKIMQELVQFGFKLLAAIAIYIVGAWVVKKIRRALTKVLEKRDTEKTLASFITSFVSLLLTVMLVMLTIGALGLNTTSIAAMLGAGVMAIGMALSGTMENFAGGLIILIFKPFKAGDLIAVQGFIGTVTEVSIVSTKIRTTDGRLVVIPNGSMSNGTVDNYTARPYRRLEWKVSVEYGTDAQKCIDAMLELASQDERILKADPSSEELENAYAVLASMDDSYIVIMLRAWVKKDDYWSVLFDMNKLLYTELPKRGFTFAFPHMDISMKSK